MAGVHAHDDSGVEEGATGDVREIKVTELDAMLDRGTKGEGRVENVS